MPDVAPQFVTELLESTGPGSASWASSPAVRKSMVGNRRSNTTPELALRRALHRLGLRYRVDARPLPEVNRRADIVFRPARVAVFVHGCFWHGCPEHYVPPKTNDRYWRGKVEGNMRRDIDTESRLRTAGWLPLTVWEHEDPDAAAAAIMEAVLAQRARIGR